MAAETAAEAERLNLMYEGDTDAMYSDWERLGPRTRGTGGRKGSRWQPR